MADPGFAAYVGTVRRGCTLVDDEGHRRNVVWTNTNHLLEVEGFEGVKTGTTNAAGSCLVAAGSTAAAHVQSWIPVTLGVVGGVLTILLLVGLRRR